MSQKNDTGTLIAALLITLGLVGAGFWWLSSRWGMNPVPVISNVPATPVAERLSVGERILIPENAPPAKQAGVDAIASNNYETAIAQLQTTLQTQRNDPEALIYLNNAKIARQTTYAIAVVVPTATAVNAAKEILRGVAQAQTNINAAGGVNGVPLRVVIANDDNSPEIAPQIAESLVNNRDILGVVGHFGSDASLAAAPVYQQGQLPMISPTSTSVKLSGLGNYIFRTVPSDRFAGNALSRYLLQTLQKQKAAVFFNAGSDYSQSLKNEFTTAVFGDGGEVVAEFDLNNPTFSPGTTVQQAKERGAEVLVLLPNTAVLDQALQIVAVNRRQLPLLAGDSAYTAKTLEVGGDNAVGMVLAVAWNLYVNPNAEFPQQGRQLWGGDVNWRTAMAYDATQALIAALGRNPTREGVQQALISPDFVAKGAEAEIRFQPSGDRNQAVQLVQVQPGNLTSYGFEFVPIPK